MSAYTRLISAASCLSLAAAAVIDLPVSAYNGYKTVEVQIGTPPKSYHLLFDTGSASSWAVDAACATTTCPNSSGYARVGYDMSASATSNLTGKSASISYLGGVVSGPTVLDAWIAGAETWDQPFIAANQSNWFALAADGFLGMAFSSIALGGATPVVEALMAQGHLTAPRFGIYYGPEVDDTSAGGTVGTPGAGVVTLGGSREADFAVEGTTLTVPVTKFSLDYDVWRTTNQGLTANRTVDGVSAGTYVDFNFGTAVFDTGAASITLPRDQTEAVYAAIGMNYTAIARGDHLPLCSEFDDSWSVSFRLGYFSSPKWLTVTGSQLARPGFAGRADACWPPFEKGNANSFALIGTQLLRNFYTIWDYGSMNATQYAPSVGFAQLKNQPSWTR